MKKKKIRKQFGKNALHDGVHPSFKGLHLIICFTIIKGCELYPDKFIVCTGLDYHELIIILMFKRVD